jgi:hypothetical protein
MISTGNRRRLNRDNRTAPHIAVPPYTAEVNATVPDLPPQHALLEARGIAIHRRDHQVGHLLAMIIPGAAIGEDRLHVLAEQARHMSPCGARLSPRVEGISISTIGSRLQPSRLVSS